MKFDSKKVKLMSLGLTGIFLCGIGMTSNAHANPILSDDFVELDYTWTQLNDSEETNPQGVAAEVSYSLTDQFFVEGGYDYEHAKIKESDLSLNGNLFKYGVGGVLELSKEAHLLGHIGGLHAKVDGGGHSVDDDAFYTTVELRYAVNPDLEVDPFIQYDSLFGEDNYTYGLKAVHVLDGPFALTAAVTGNDDSDLGLSAGLRFAFCN